MNSGCEPWSRAVPQGINIEPGIVAGAADALAAVAEKYSHGVVRMAGLNPDRQLKRFSVQLELDHVSALHADALGHLGTQLQRIVPGHLAHRFGQFLQPAIVGKLAVVDAGVAAEVDLDCVLTSSSRRRWKIRCFRRNLLRLECGAVNPAFM